MHAIDASRLGVIALGGGVALLVGFGVWAVVMASREATPAPIAAQPKAPPRALDDVTGEVAEAAPSALGSIGVRELLPELYDLETLTRKPNFPFNTLLASSYDRRSKRPDDANGWFANDDWVSFDRDNVTRVETSAKGELTYVLLDVAGPGAVVRLWTATPFGSVRITLDDRPEPTIDAPLRELLSGAMPPLGEPFGHVTARGYNLVFPIPFAKHCRITTDTISGPNPFDGTEEDKFYYQVTYRLYRGPTQPLVRTLTRRELGEARPTIAAAGASLSAEPKLAANASTKRLAIDATATLGTLELTADRDGSEVRELSLVGKVSDDTLAHTMLTMEVDGAPAIEAPLGAFFGSAPGWNSFRTLPLSVDDHAMHCRFPMPFHKRAVLHVKRDGGADPIVLEAVTVPRKWDDATFVFHARGGPPTRMPTRPFRDFTMADVTGEGFLVGSILDVENPRGATWWGEGDEKIFVDGEAFPSLFGTGTEDHYGYAWSSPERFSHPLHAQTRADGPRFDGHFSMNRFLTIDRVPFTTSLRFDMELWHWQDTHVNVDSVAYWYAR